MERWKPWSPCDRSCDGGKRSRELRDATKSLKDFHSWDYTMTCNNNKCLKGTGSGLTSD